MWRWVKKVGRGRGIRDGELKTGDDSGSRSPLGTEDAARVLLGFRGQGCFLEVSGWENINTEYNDLQHNHC